MATPRRSRVHKGAQRTRTAPSRHPLERAPDKFIGGPQPHAPRVPRGRGELQNGRRRRGRPQGIVEAARIDAFTASSSIRRTVSHSFGSPTSLKNGRDAFGAADRARRDGPGRPRPPSPHRLDVGRRAAPSPSFGAPYEDLWSVEEANRRQAAAAPLNHGPIDGVGSIAHRFAGAPGSSGGASNRSGASFGAADRATRARLMRPGGDAANADKRGLDGPGPAVASPRDWSRSRTGAVMLGGGPGARDSYALPQPGSGHSVDRGPGAYSGASPSSFGRQTESGRRSARAGGMGSLRRHLAADADSPGGFSTFAGKELGVPGPGSVPRAVRSSVGKQTESLYVTLPRPKISPAGYISRANEYDGWSALVAIRLGPQWTTLPAAARRSGPPPRDDRMQRAAAEWNVAVAPLVAQTAEPQRDAATTSTPDPDDLAVWQTPDEWKGARSIVPPGGPHIAYGLDQAVRPAQSTPKRDALLHFRT